MSLITRKCGLLVLVALFFVQSWLVYSDTTGRETGPLSKLGLEGRDIWHRKNCQSCHQLYGYGGFLGPDLTNAIDELPQTRIDSILTEGALQMPPFQFAESERQAIVAFLREISATGVGQLPPLAKFDPGDALDLVIASTAKSSGQSLSSSQQAGRELVREQACLSCHLPNEFSTLRGTDMTTLVAKLGPQGIAAIVSMGIPSKGMPPFALEPKQLDQLVAFLEWMATNAEAIHHAFSISALPQSFSGLPWFEYSR